MVIWEAEDKERVYKVSPTMTVSELVCAWKLDEGTEEEEWSASREGGATLTGAEELVTVSEGKKTVLIYLERRPVEEAAEETATLSLALFGESGDTREIVVSLSRTLAELHPAVRERFGLPEERFFRLLREDGPLSYDVCLREAGVPVAGPILVDLAYEVEIEDSWSGDIECHFVYASECLFDLLESAPPHKKRVYLGPLQIDSSRCLASTLPAHVRQLTRIRLLFEYQRCVTLRVNGRWKRHQVWPQERLEKVLPPSSVHDCWRYEGEDVSREQTFYEIGLQDQAMLIQERPVLVNYSTGEGAVLWLPELSTVAHLREEVLKTEEDADFCLKLGHRVLQLEEYVPQLCDSSNAVTVVRSENAFAVDLDGKEVKWLSRSGDIRFSQFCYELVQHGNLKWNDLAEVEFRCDGCGRQIRRSEEAYQLLPADCCHMRSLTLSSYTPVEVKGE